MNLDILFEDNHCLAVAKPAGISSTHFDGRNETIDRLVKVYLKTKYAKTGNVFLGIVHRLDKATSGVILFARTSKAAARLSEQFRNGAIEKTYWAIVEGELQPVAGTMEDHLCRSETTHLVSIVDATHANAKAARTHYQVRATRQGLSWLELRPQTGRKHQLRVQLASRKHPVVGDFAYGSEIPFSHGIALHARQLIFLHPIHKSPIALQAAVPSSWRRRFKSLLESMPQ